MSHVNIGFVFLSLVAVSPGLETCGDQPKALESEQLVADVTLDEIVMLQLSTGMQTQEDLRVVDAADDQAARSNFSFADKVSTDSMSATFSQMADFGDARCPCIGIDNLDGDTNLEIQGDVVQYPADLGARCEAWDDGSHPLCKTGSGEAPDWCGEPWCFVDPCNCKISEGPVPRISSYLPEAKFQGKGIFFSYNTCGGVDTYTGSKDGDFCVNQKTWSDCESLPRCEWTLSETCVGTEVQGQGCGNTAQESNDERIWGTDECACIGVSGKNGTTEVVINSVDVDYPGDVGSTCKAWDDDLHPDCAGADPKPEWCGRKWCYIDPCKCTISTPPKVITYLPDSSFQGKDLYYSYATCGNEDVYTASGEHPNACVNQMTKKDCAAQGSKCTWTSPKRFGWEGCIGTKLATLCSAELRAAYSGCHLSSFPIVLMSAFYLLW